VEETYVYDLLDVALHDRTAFSSGSAPLDRYLRQQARQDMRQHKDIAALFGYGSTYPDSLVSSCPASCARNRAISASSVVIRRWSSSRCLASRSRSSATTRTD
jgi:hypothetical protein